MTGELRAWLEVAEGSDEEFVDAVFALVLRRDPEPDARERALAKLGEGTLSRATLVHELTDAPEFERIRLLDDGIAFARGARERGERPRWLHGPRDTDERVIEVPWVLARLSGRRALEVGYAFAEPPYLAALLQAGFEELAGVDLAHADVPGLTGVQADVRDLPFEDGAFDLVLCVSTLEHVGADNTGDGLEAEDDADSRRTALRELRRVLASNGRLLITVPCGEPGDYGWFRQDDVRGSTWLFTGWASSSRSRRCTSLPATAGGRQRSSIRRGSVTASEARRRRPSSAPNSHRDGSGACSARTESSERPAAAPRTRCAPSPNPPNGVGLGSRFGPSDRYLC